MFFYLERKNISAGNVTFDVRSQTDRLSSEMLQLSSRAVSMTQYVSLVYWNNSTCDCDLVYSHTNDVVYGSDNG